MKKRTIDDDTPLRIGPLAQYMGIGRATLYRDVHAGYTFECLTRKMTTAGHYKAWLRERATTKATELAAQKKVDEERLQREQCLLLTDADKSHAPRSSRGSRSASPAPAKSSRSSRPA